MIVIKHACRGLSQWSFRTFLNIEKTDSSDSLKREDYRRWTICTMTPYDLNIEDHV